jgi:O-antigen ligase
MADQFAVLMAITLPWSTTILGVFTALWLTTFATVLDLSQFRKQFHRPVSWLPVALFGLAVVGMLWADAPWAARAHAAGTIAKLLAIPLLIYQFERSENGIRIFLSFLTSCTVLLALSWLNWLAPQTVLFSGTTIGVPVKNYITQDVEFVLCIFGTAALAIIAWQKHRPFTSVGLLCLAFGFFLNIALVASSRTSLVSLPLLLLVSTLWYITWRRALVLYVAIAAIAAFAWFFAPNLRHRIEGLQQEYSLRSSQPTSVGLRLEYWSNALHFITNAPLIGHGTGSIRGLFERNAMGKAVTDEHIVANPHNQTLYFAIEWGIIGVMLLYAMWITHLLMFTEMRWISWLGIIVVSQNILGSFFNSHLSDYVEGWIYVMGVGVAAGIVSKGRKSSDIVASTT